MLTLLFLGLDEDCKTDRDEIVTDSSQSDEEDDHIVEDLSKPSETPYLVNQVEELGQVTL